MLIYIIAYDITCNKRRHKTANILKGYGRRVQYSVFECVLPPAKYRELQQRLKLQLNFTEDNVRFYPLSQHTATSIEAWGMSLEIAPALNSIVV